jgi:hypothetical protein
MRRCIFKLQLLILLLGASAASSSAQEPTALPCPVITVSCPEWLTGDSPLTFTAKVMGGGYAAEPTYSWTVSAGTIISGQGTPTIVVQTSGFLGHTFTARVEVGGFDRACANVAACWTKSCGLRGCHLIDVYSDISFQDEKVRLNTFARELEGKPDARGYIKVYAGRPARAGAAEIRANRAKSYLVHERGIDARRIVTIIAGHHEWWAVELYVLPPGVTFPPTEPTVKPDGVPITGRQTRGRGSRAKP